MNSTTFNKVELAKMFGLKLDPYNKVSKHDIVDCLECHWGEIKWTFCDDNIIVSVCVDDFAKDKLDIKELDLVEDGDVKACIKAVEDLLWERAADRYLECIHEVAMFFCGNK